ncbi:hypothetical protein AB205_0020520 [Aquarana catesbeiana]|uniref:Uncharacterized protein n=1 Tax=Aquarana catesbeiana TaxID=8400 RepID=A0A2G9RSJ6_AQUCT|nr:hypothetical protein AB205_0020520 [Aquarana catesbeiana]
MTDVFIVKRKLFDDTGCKYCELLLVIYWSTYTMVTVQPWPSFENDTNINFHKVCCLSVSFLSDVTMVY